MIQDDPDGAAFKKQGEYYYDAWGCLWHCLTEGIGGQPVEHPLADWKALKSYRPPDLLQTTRWGQAREDWRAVKNKIDQNKRNGVLTSTKINCFFDRLHYLRGFDNLLMDLAAEPPELFKLIDLVLRANMKLLYKQIELKPDVMNHHGDIGTQFGLMMSPEVFRKCIKPGYKKMFMACRNAGIPVLYSSDGKLLEIIDDLIECGVSAHDPQLGVNTLEGIIRVYKGKLCAMVDLSQEIALWHSKEINEHIEEIIKKLGSPEGGLIIKVWGMPDIRLENIETLCVALEKFRLYHTRV
jgi:uroporphyrinogen decarboxylase